jgi:predicted transposase YdaD
MLAERVTEWTEEWKRQGRQEGLQEGRQEGRQEGEALLLLRLLELRFGELDETSRARIRRADTETLLRWCENFLTATSISEVFKT